MTYTVSSGTLNPSIPYHFTRQCSMTHLRCCGIFNDCFIICLLLSPLVKICQHLGKLWGRIVSCIFDSQSIRFCPVWYSVAILWPILPNEHEKFITKHGKCVKYLKNKQDAAYQMTFTNRYICGKHFFIKIQKQGCQLSDIRQRDQARKVPNTN